jgi:hypothetical protein
MKTYKIAQINKNIYIKFWTAALSSHLMAFCHRSPILSLASWDASLDAQVVLSQLLASLTYNHHNAPPSPPPQKKGK